MIGGTERDETVHGIADGNLHFFESILLRSDAQVCNIEESSCSWVDGLVIVCRY